MSSYHGNDLSLISEKVMGKNYLPVGELQQSIHWVLTLVC